MANSESTPTISSDSNPTIPSESNHTISSVEEEEQSPRRSRLPPKFDYLRRYGRPTESNPTIPSVEEEEQSSRRSRPPSILDYLRSYGILTESTPTRRSESTPTIPSESNPTIPSESNPTISSDEEVEEQSSRRSRRPSKFDYLRGYGIQVAMDQFHEAMAIMMKHNHIEEFWLDRKEMTETIFCWSPEDFWSRIQDASISYDIMMSVVHPEVLEKKKLLVGLQEIQKHMMGLVSHFMGGIHYDGIEKSLILLKSFRDIRKNLQSENEANFSEYVAEQMAYLLSNINRSMDMDQLIDPDTSLGDNIVEAIKCRLVTRNYSAYATVQDISTKQVVDNLEKELIRGIRKVGYMRTCFEYTMSGYYTEIEVYKSRLAEMNQRLAYYEEMWDNKVLESHRHLEKFDDDFKHYREELARFRAAKAAMLERDRKAALENLKRQEELAAKMIENEQPERKRKNKKPFGKPPAKRVK